MLCSICCVELRGVVFNMLCGVCVVWCLIYGVVVCRVVLNILCDAVFNTLCGLDLNMLRGVHL